MEKEFVTLLDELRNAGGKAAPDVYVVGHDENVAALWKNGIKQTLIVEKKIYAKAQSVFVADNDVYVAGHNENVAILWKNGTPQNLTECYEDYRKNRAVVNSVYVSGNDVYVVGYEEVYDVSLDDWCTLKKQVAKLWKNGVAQSLADENKFTEAHSVFVSGNDVYVAGHEYNTGKRFVVLWKNGIAQKFTDGNSYLNTYSVFVSGNDVYVTGYGILFKNGIKQTLPTNDYFGNASSKSVYVSGKDVYVAGYEGYTIYDPVLWKNGVLQNLNHSDGKNVSARAHSVFVSGSDVYVAGVEYTFSSTPIALLWINGEIQNLGYGAANSVFVVK